MFTPSWGVDHITLHNLHVTLPTPSLSSGCDTYLSKPFDAVCTIWLKCDKCYKKHHCLYLPVIMQCMTEKLNIEDVKDKLLSRHNSCMYKVNTGLKAMLTQLLQSYMLKT